MQELLESLVWRVFGTVPQFSIVVLVLALLGTCVGFRRPPWFFGIGCGFAMIGMSAATILAYRHRLGMLSGIQLGILLVHGARLAAFLVWREQKAAFHRRPLVNDTSGIRRIGRRAGVWLAVSLVYVCMFSPALYATVGEKLLVQSVTVTLQLLGTTIMVAGMVLEAFADWQKSAFKAYRPDACCYSGLYGWVRQPNHLGAVIFWAGNFVAGAGYLVSPMHWLIAIAGLAGITLLIIAFARRLESARAAQYGGLSEYQGYVQSVPVLIPWQSPEAFSPRPPND